MDLRHTDGNKGAMLLVPSVEYEVTAASVELLPVQRLSGRRFIGACTVRGLVSLSFKITGPEK